MTNGLSKTLGSATSNTHANKVDSSLGESPIV